MICLCVDCVWNQKYKCKCPYLTITKDGKCKWMIKEDKDNEQSITNII